MRASSTKSISLSPERLAILLALAYTPASAPDIAGQVVADSVGNLYLKGTSFYRMLHELERKSFITNSPVYDLTPKGWRTLEHELQRVETYRRHLKIRLSPRQYKAPHSDN